MNMQDYSKIMNKYAFQTHEKFYCCFDAIKDAGKDA